MRMRSTPRGGRVLWGMIVAALPALWGCGEYRDSWTYRALGAVQVQEETGGPQAMALGGMWQSPGGDPGYLDTTQVFPRVYRTDADRTADRPRYALGILMDEAVGGLSAHPMTGGFAKRHREDGTVETTWTYPAARATLVTTACDPRPDDEGAQVARGTFTVTLGQGAAPDVTLTGGTFTITAVYDPVWVPWDEKY